PSPAILGIVAIGYAIYCGTNKSSMTLCPVGAAQALGQGCSTASPGIGIYVAGVGGLLALIFGYRIWRPAADEYDEATAAMTPPTDGSFIETRIHQLNDLRERGIITEAEY